MQRNIEILNIATLPTLGARALQEIHCELFGATHPITNMQHLRRKIAWHIQAVRSGGLPEVVRALALSIARDTDIRVRTTENVRRRLADLAPDRTATTRLVTSPGDSRLPMPGSLIVRNYQGRNIVVKVLDDGFEYDGRPYSSLSAIANEITGTRWNGFVFFRLGKEAKHGR